MVQGLRSRRLLGRHVHRRAADDQVGRQAGRLAAVGAEDQAEVEELDEVVEAAALGDEQVRRLQVAVDQRLGVRLGQRPAGLADQVDDPAGRHRAVALDEGVDPEPRQQFHHVVEDAVAGPPVVVNIDRVRVGQLGRGADLALEAGRRRRVAGPLGADQLDGALALQELVLGDVDVAHPAAAEPRGQPVLAEAAGPLQLGPHPAEHMGPVQPEGRPEDDDQRDHRLVAGLHRLPDEGERLGVVGAEQRQLDDRHQRQRDDDPRRLGRTMRQDHPVQDHEHRQPERLLAAADEQVGHVVVGEGEPVSLQGQGDPAGRQGPEERVLQDQQDPVRVGPADRERPEDQADHRQAGDADHQHRPREPAVQRQAPRRRSRRRRAAGRRRGRGAARGAATG